MMPAQFTRISRVPKALRQATVQALIWVGFDRSQTSISTFEPRASAARALIRRLGSSISTKKRSAPSRANARAMAAPIPLAAPVTSAFFPRIISTGRFAPTWHGEQRDQHADNNEHPDIAPLR